MKIYEMAIWNGHPTALHQRELIVEETNRNLGNLSGFINRTVYQAIDQENLFFDWVEWETMEDASRAADLIGKEPVFQGFMKVIESVKTVSHFSLVFSATPSPIDRNSILELVLYELKANSKIDAWQQPFKKELTDSSFLQHLVIHHVQEEKVWGDLIWWDSAATAQQTMGKMMKNPSIGVAVSAINEVRFNHVLFQQF